MTKQRIIKNTGCPKSNPAEEALTHASPPRGGGGNAAAGLGFPPVGRGSQERFGSPNTCFLLFSFLFLLGVPRRYRPGGASRRKPKPAFFLSFLFFFHSVCVSPEAHCLPAGHRGNPNMKGTIQYEHTIQGSAEGPVRVVHPHDPILRGHDGDARVEGCAAAQEQRDVRIYKAHVHHRGGNDY